MFAEIIATGDEIRSGVLVDSNSAHISRELEIAGVKVLRHHSVGDDLNQLVDLFHEVGHRCQVAIVTGGLGPTVDDLSAQAAAIAAGVELATDPEALRIVERFFKKVNRAMTPSNRKQADLPEGAVVLDNPVGTAPGFRLSIDKCVFYFLPGVPYEMKQMLQNEVLPKVIESLGGQQMFPKVKTISCFGLPESLVGEKMEGLSLQFPGLKLGLRAKFPEIQVKLYGQGRDTAQLDAQFAAATTWVRRELGHHVFSEDGKSIAEVVGELLRKEGATLAAAESCTGGLIAHRLTNVPGSSDYFLLSAVTYANSAKIDVLGVRPQTIEAFGAVSKETAAEMAEGVRKIAKATYGLAVSGIAGPGGGTPDKPVGTLCTALSTPEETQAHRHHFTYGRRQMFKSMFAMAALDLLRKHLEK